MRRLWSEICPLRREETPRQSSRQVKVEKSLRGNRRGRGRRPQWRPGPQITNPRLASSRIFLRRPVGGLTELPRCFFSRVSSSFGKRPLLPVPRLFRTPCHIESVFFWPCFARAQLVRTTREEKPSALIACLRRACHHSITHEYPYRKRKHLSVTRGSHDVRARLSQPAWSALHSTL